MSQKVQQTCQGRKQFAGQKRDALNARIKKLTARMALLKKELRPPYRLKIAELKAELKALDGQEDNHFLGRAGCGYDLSGQIAAIPADGDVYEYLCPRCGNTGSVRKEPIEA